MKRTRHKQASCCLPGAAILPAQQKWPASEKGTTVQSAVRATPTRIRSVFITATWTSSGSTRQSKWGRNASNWGGETGVNTVVRVLEEEEDRETEPTTSHVVPSFLNKQNKAQPHWKSRLVLAPGCSAAKWLARADGMAAVPH